MSEVVSACFASTSASIHHDKHPTSDIVQRPSKSLHVTNFKIQFYSSVQYLLVLLTATALIIPMSEHDDIDEHIAIRRMGTT
jgi:hypothetical protein